MQSQEHAITAAAFPVLMQIDGFPLEEISITNADELKYLLIGFGFLYRHYSAAQVLVPSETSIRPRLRPGTFPECRAPH